jgi:hypothetical protein
MSASAHLIKGQRVRIVHNFKPGDGVIDGRIQYEGTVSELYGVPLRSVDLEEGAPMISVVDDDYRDVVVTVLGWNEGSIAYIDWTGDNPGTDILVAARGHGWCEIVSGYRTFWFDDSDVTNVRPVHDGKVPHA